jgi:hypothetical protein
MALRGPPVPAVQVRVTGLSRVDDGSGHRQKTSIHGTFHPDRYLANEDCIFYDGQFLSRSRFEKEGGSTTAKWYCSIKVAATNNTLGSWLAQNGLPVLKGGARTSKRMKQQMQQPLLQQQQQRQHHHQQPAMRSGSACSDPAGAGGAAATAAGSVRRSPQQQPSSPSQLPAAAPRVGMGAAIAAARRTSYSSGVSLLANAPTGQQRPGSGRTQQGSASDISLLLELHLAQQQHQQQQQQDEGDRLRAAAAAASAGPWLGASSAAAATAAMGRGLGSGQGQGRAGRVWLGQQGLDLSALMAAEPMAMEALPPYVLEGTPSAAGAPLSGYHSYPFSSLQVCKQFAACSVYGCHNAFAWQPWHAPHNSCAACHVTISVWSMSSMSTGRDAA